jgi:hypothetical protein
MNKSKILLFKNMILENIQFIQKNTNSHSDFLFTVAVIVNLYLDVPEQAFLITLFFFQIC